MVIPIFLTCGPNEVLVVSGVGYEKPAMIVGGRVIAFTCFQRWRRLSLNIMALTVESPDVYTMKGVPLKVTGIAQVKISSNVPEVLELACENFLGKSQRELEDLVTSTLEGHQRGIIGTMSVEDIYKDRKLFNTRVFESASKDLCTLGLQLLSYTIKNVSDDNGYLMALGMSRTAEVQRDARIGEAIAQKDASIKKAIADEELTASKYANETLKAQANRDFETQKAGYDREVNTKKAEADLAYTLQECITRQKIREEEMETKVVERKGQIALEEQEIERCKKHIESTIKQPATAEKYRLEVIAAAERQKAVLEAEAEAEAIKLKGEAEAFAIEKRAKADAAQLHSKAEAYDEFGKAAILDMYLNTLPKMIGNIGQALANTRSVKMVSTGDSALGAHKMTKEVIDIAVSVPDMINDMTGVNLKKAIQTAV
ncbi:flotillin-1-like isoform X1 [Macrobrachium rosenbergii]|uniref:flotillin-1-like isoform X1 n=2 Tax=Macrobrachium rosenbergii TaxID=79674 RepID=UPI0034D732EB